ncbi:hypothetical protein FHS42_001302 [Streptomyces zagrosensis]|uniref:Uncharacterized protein n=1 Tax=Streptomyces zagrosensis TaxID=1042984 RepID=A0A7W9UXG4_9ACTN|nr:hypothetical protein [Streptomyces zagrosensis]
MSVSTGTVLIARTPRELRKIHGGHGARESRPRPEVSERSVS